MFNKKPKEISKFFIRCFNSTDGKEVLNYLKNQTGKNCLSPNATDAELRHLQGQRYIINLIENLSNPKK